MKKTIPWLVCIVVLAVGVGLGFVLKAYRAGDFSAAAPLTTPHPETLVGVATGAAPWPVEIAHLKQRLMADNLPALSAEGTKLHIHQHLDVYLEGVPLQIPSGIGVSEAAGFISPVHSHDTSGIIHVESPVVQDFTLGQFFDIWGVKFTKTCIAGYCEQTGYTLKIYVNGQLYTGDPRTLVLSSHQEIAIVYGTDAQTPKTIPATYTFPSGY